MPTSGGSRDSETSELTVSPARLLPSATTTDTPVGQRRKSARCSAPRSSTVPRLACAVPGSAQFGLQRLSSSAAIFTLAASSAAWLYGPGGLPSHITSGVTPGPITVARYLRPLPAGCEPCGLKL